MTTDDAEAGAPAREDQAATGTSSVETPADPGQAVETPVTTVVPETAPEIDPDPVPDADPDPASPETDALSWVDIERLAVSTATGSSATAAFAKERGDLLSDAPRRPALLRPAVLVPLAVIVGVAGAYTGTAALWPLHDLAPTISAVSLQPEPAPSAVIAWPAAGSAAVGIEGLGAIASSDAQAPMASITKVVTVLAALERMPLAPGEQGPSFSFSQSDSNEYWRYLQQDQSALDVPVDGSLTEYQLIQGILLGSANNYADRLAREVWGADRDYVEAAQGWLRMHDLGGAISLENPSGFGMGNTATPRALLRLGEIAVHHPVVKEIVATKSAEIPGAGTVKNSNKLLDEEGFIGVKTGTIGDTGSEDFNLLSAKEIVIDGLPVVLYASVLGQPDDETRYAVSRSLYADVERVLKNQPQTIAQGTVLGTVTTAWGETAEAISSVDAKVILWNGAAATTTTALSLGEEWTKGAEVGTLTVKGPIDSQELRIELGSELHGPDLWWRLTHPLELFGLDAR
ncbi:D-alanyl-D-alanine carboxypeptidase [Microbacterium resistens]|uniref:D-alanyl-D-alanine carboxypeptidase n=1 Tax=Microbacterium resistens TaxID=156977 RepID=A0ABU1SBA0_9MICO|nr:D-alanyl-D-alanine carboxypeptidase [Microbacterium resistens]MDR6866870.1 D-alanyl-D-alanine carboxypeptidase [Microbacterium resistens]